MITRSRRGTKPAPPPLPQPVGADPAAASWTLGDDVAELRADFDDRTDDLVAGAKLAGTAQHLGIGEPLTETGFSMRVKITAASGPTRTGLFSPSASTSRTDRPIPSPGPPPWRPGHDPAIRAMLNQ